jgi:CubicO group peptidase (beta-lactamase class C family)
MLSWNYDPWEVALGKVCAARLEPGWTPGERAGYHVAGSWLVLGEIVRRLDGRPFEQYLREEIYLPLGMIDSWNGMPPERYRGYGNRIGFMHDTAKGAAKPSFIADTEAGCALCRPGGNGHGPIRELAFFYEMILGKGDRLGRRILSPQTVEAMTACHRRGMVDETFDHLMDWSLGFIPDNNLYGPEMVSYGYGAHCSWRTVGHGGYQSSVGFADPRHGLAAGIVFNGCPGEEIHALRMHRAATALYEDLGLAPSGEMK